MILLSKNIGKTTGLAKNGKILCLNIFFWKRREKQRQFEMMAGASFPKLDFLDGAKAKEKPE